MKLAVTLAKDKNGSWHMLADPSVPVVDQRRDFNRLKLADFVHQGTAYAEGLVLSTQGIEKKGVAKGPAFVPPKPPPQREPAPAPEAKSPALPPSRRPSRRKADG